LPAQTQAAPTLDEALQEQAKTILQHLRAKKYKNVGVLKFLVQKGDDKPSDNAGPLNRVMADRLEIALILANPDDQLGIIHQASAVVAKHGGCANHLTAGGRRKLLQLNGYVRAWENKDADGNEIAIRAEALLTGLVHIQPELDRTTVTVLAFDRQDNELTKVASFSAPLDARTLTEAGYSFRRRSVTPTTRPQEGNADPDNKGGNDLRIADKNLNPLQNSPIEVQILYDDQPQPIQVKNGEPSVEGPRAGQQVSFLIKNRGTETYGVVFKINGMNSLGKQKLPSAQCRKWVVEPNESVPVVGFQVSKDRAEAFSVMTPEESEADEINYEEHVGTFSIQVFPAKGRDEARLTEEDAASQTRSAIRNAEILPDRPQSLAALQGQLKRQHQAKTNKEGERRVPSKGPGLIKGGKEIENAIRVVPFEAAADPVWSTTIRYYEPKTLK
jgi:hypothetical protein